MEDVLQQQVNLTNSIQDSLRSMDLKKPILSALAQKGDEEVGLTIDWSNWVWVEDQL